MHGLLWVVMIALTGSVTPLESLLPNPTTITTSSEGNLQTPSLAHPCAAFDKLRNLLITFFCIVILLQRGGTFCLELLGGLLPSKQSG